LINNAKRWGRWSTLGLGLIAALVGQMVALTALIWWYGLDLAQLLDLAADGVAVTLIVCISTPVQVLLLALMARQAGANAADYLGFRLPRKSDVVVGIIVVLVFIAVADGTSWLLRRDIVTQFQLDIYRTASTAGWRQSERKRSFAAFCFEAGTALPAMPGQRSS
jgi:hypothetical protein